MAKFLRISFTACVIIAFCFLLSGCNTAQNFNWTMYGAVIDENGYILEHLEFTVEGKLCDYTSDPDQLNIEVLTPENYPYSLPNLSNVHSSESHKNKDLPYFSCRTYAYDKINDSSIFSAFALDIEQECVIFKWGDTDSSYLVGCTNSNTDLAMVFDHFQGFLQHYANSSTP